MRPLTILVVDDDRPTREVLQLWLKLHGHAAVAAASGNEALEVLRDGGVDLVLTDVLMPDGNGIDLISRVRREHPGTRVLAISGGGAAASSASCLERARGAGANALLLKPFQQDQLLSAIQYVTGGRDLVASPHRRTPTAAAEREFREFPGLAGPARSRERA